MAERDLARPGEQLDHFLLERLNVDWRLRRFLSLRLLRLQARGDVRKVAVSAFPAACLCPEETATRPRTCARAPTLKRRAPPLLLLRLPRREGA